MYLLILMNRLWSGSVTPLDHPIQSQSWDLHCIPGETLEHVNANHEAEMSRDGGRAERRREEIVLFVSFACLMITT